MIVPASSDLIRAVDQLRLLTWAGRQTDTDVTAVSSAMDILNRHMQEQQIRQWMHRHGLDRESTLTAGMVLSARDGDQLEAQRIEIERKRQ
jgi:hypothetical protein